MSTSYNELFKLIEEAIFQQQAQNVFDVMRHVRRKTRNNNLDKSEVERIMTKVATQYKQS